MGGIWEKAGSIVPDFAPVREKNTGSSGMERILPGNAVGSRGSCRGGGISAGISENIGKNRRLYEESDSPTVGNIFQYTGHAENSY